MIAGGGGGWIVDATTLAIAGGGGCGGVVIDGAASGSNGVFDEGKVHGCKYWLILSIRYTSKEIMSNISRFLTVAVGVADGGLI